MRRALLLVTLATIGCATVEPGHRGLYFSSSKGLEHEPLLPGRHWCGLLDRIDDFDVTYSTRNEEIQTTSVEGLSLTLKIAVIFRPVLAELYDLETEIGLNYYDEVVGREFRSAARGVFARHSYLELLSKNEQLEDEIEADLRRRIKGKHIEIASITLESIQYANEIAKTLQDKLVAEQDAARQKTMLENEAMRSKLSLTSAAEQSKLRAETALREKQQEAELATQQAALDRIREESEAAKRMIKAKADAEAARFAAETIGRQERAHNQALTPLSVTEKGYEALKALGDRNANIMIGDWSKVPNFLFPLPGLAKVARP